MQLFGDGYLCHPYLSLSYLDLLSEKNIHGYLVGATNVLFKQKKSLFDVVIEVSLNILHSALFLNVFIILILNSWKLAA